MTAWLPSKTFWIVLLRLFSFKFCHILSTVGFINEDNYCHSQRIGQLIKEKLLKGIFKVDWLFNVAANTQISPSLLLTSAICKPTINFFLHECFLEFFFPPEIMLECWGCGLFTSAAYTRVFTVNTGTLNLEFEVTNFVSEKYFAFETWFFYHLPFIWVALSVPAG